MKQIEVSNVTGLEEILQHAKQGDVVLTRQGHAVAVVSEIDDTELYWYDREREPEFLASIQRARDQVKHGDAIAHDDLKRELGIE